MAPAGPDAGESAARFLGVALVAVLVAVPLALVAVLLGGLEFGFGGADHEGATFGETKRGHDETKYTRVTIVEDGR